MTTRTWLTLTAAYALLAAGPALGEEAPDGHGQGAGHCTCASHGSATHNAATMDHGATDHGATVDAGTKPAPVKVAAAPAARTIAIQVTAEFTPAEIHVKRGEAVKLVFTRTTDRTCATSVHFRELGLDRELPLGKPVTVALKPAQAGKYRFSCGMDMVAGTLVVD